MDYATADASNNLTWTSDLTVSNTVWTAPAPIVTGEGNNEINVEIDPDGPEGPLAPVKFGFKLDGNAYIWFAIGFIVGVAVHWGIAHFV